MDTWISLGGGNRRDLLGKLGAGSMRMGEMGIWGVGLEGVGVEKRESNEREVLMEGVHFGVRKKPGARETARNPQSWLQLFLQYEDLLCWRRDIVRNYSLVRGPLLGIQHHIYQDNNCNATSTWIAATEQNEPVGLLEGAEVCCQIWKCKHQEWRKGACYFPEKVRAS